MGVLGGSKNQKSGKCHELSRKSIIFVLTHVPGVLGGQNFKSARNFTNCRENRLKKNYCRKKCNHYPTPSDGGAGGLRAKISK